MLTFKVLSNDIEFKKKNLKLDNRHIKVFFKRKLIILIKNQNILQDVVIK